MLEERKARAARESMAKMPMARARASDRVTVLYDVGQCSRLDADTQMVIQESRLSSVVLLSRGDPCTIQWWYSGNLGRRDVW
jgi:hypothetical protein